MKQDTANHIIGVISFALWAIAIGVTAVLVATLILGGQQSMSNDQIIAEVKKCNDAGLVGQVIFDKQKRYVIGVQCITTIKEAIEQPTGWEA